MKRFFSYIKYNLKWLFFTGLLGSITTVVLWLNDIPREEIVYSVFLELFFLIVAVAWDFAVYDKKIDRLKEFTRASVVSLERMEEPEDALEAEYQECVRRLFAEKVRLENEGIGRQKDLTEYYTMWVHQIKTPIAALHLLLGERGDTDGSKEEQQELFRIEQYVDMALQYMRLGSESSDFIFKRYGLDEIIRNAVHKYAKQFIYKKISLDYEGVDRKVLTDEKWLGFVIEQLLSNAVKYTPGGGRVSIYEEEGRLVIADTGIGIRSEDLPRVCEKGYTGYNGHGNCRSTGIGLYLCSSILKKLGHTFTIMSREGEGTMAVIGFEERKKSAGIDKSNV